MRWSVLIARVAGIEVRLHLTFLLFLLWIGYGYYERGGPTAAWQGTLFLLALFACVLLHEFGHALAARCYGIPTPDITLLPIGGVARLQRIPDDPRQELVVALAGPAVNVLIAGLIVLAGHPLDFGALGAVAEPGAPFWSKLAAVNVSLVLFNLVPAFPMDGGRVLRALLAFILPHARATRYAARAGQVFAVGFGLLGVFANPLLLFIAFFIFLGAMQEASLAEMKEITSGVPVADAMVTHLIRLSPRATLDDAIEALLRTSQHEFPVVDAHDRPLGILTRDDLIGALRRHDPMAPVVDFMRRDLPVVRAYDAFDTAFRAMQECACPAVPVVDATGRFVGLITPENVGEMMMVRALQPADDRPAWRRPAAA